MFANSLIVEQLEYSGYLRVFQMQGLPDRPLTIAFADELDEPHDCPFHFLDGRYKDIFEKGFAECKALKLPESNFAIANGEYRFRTSWKGIPTYPKLFELLCPFIAKIRSSDSDSVPRPSFGYGVPKKRGA